MIVNGWILCSCKESPERTDKYYSSVDRGKCSKSVRVRVDKTSLESEKPLEDWGERVPAVFRSLARSLAFSLLARFFRWSILTESLAKVRT